VTALTRINDWLTELIAGIPPDWRRRIGNFLLVMSGLMLVWMVLALVFGWHTSPWYQIGDVSRLRFVLLTVCYNLFMSFMFWFAGNNMRRWAVKLPDRSGASSESDAQSGLEPALWPRTLAGWDGNCKHHSGPSTRPGGVTSA